MCLLRLSKLSTTQHFIWANFDHCFDFHATWRQSLGFLTRPKVERKFLFILANHKNGDGHGSQPKTKKKTQKSPDEKAKKYSVQSRISRNQSDIQLVSWFVSL